jgi:hypothetical protein
MSLPLLLAGGAALLLLSGKKKKKNGAAAAPADEYAEEAVEEEPVEAEEEEVDAGAGPDPEPEEDEGPGYGIVASGVRKDKRGHHPWRVRFEADGYHAQITLGAHRTAPVTEDVGIAATLSAAKKLLSDRFNELLIDKYPNESPKLDPITMLIAKAASLPGSGSGGGGGIGGYQG